MLRFLWVIKCIEGILNKEKNILAAVIQIYDKI
jgi:hypothetical protein